MAAVNITVTGVSQKIARNTQGASQEDTWTVTSNPNMGLPVYLIIRPSVDSLFHSTVGSTAADGLALPGGCFYPVKLGASTTFALRPVSTAGVVDCWVADAAMVAAIPYKSVILDAAGALTQGNSQKLTYGFDSIVGAPAAAGYVHLAVESGPTKTTRIRRLVIANPGAGTAAALLTFELIRTTAAGSVGTTIVPAPYETTDAAFTGICRKDGSTITAGTQLRTFSIFQPATTPGSFSPFVYEFYGQLAKALTIPAGTANGIALRCINGNAGAVSFAASFEFTEE